MKTVIFFPPSKSVTGGMHVLMQIARQLKELDRETVFYLWDRIHNSFLRDRGFEVCSDKAVTLGSNDIFLVPEGWPNVLSLGLNSKAGCVVYCQNWAYLFSGLPENISWNDLPVRFVAVSDPVRLFILESLNSNSLIIRPSIDRQLFFKPDYKMSETVNIAFMPRKNRSLYKQIRQVLESRNNVRKKIRWLEIHGLDQKEVADRLRQCHVFLATGFPEGCPLPPLEAMACGCMVVGFAGFGGWDYMRQADHGYHPQIPLRKVPWQENGFYCADGDVLDAAIKLERAVQLVENQDETLRAILDNSLKTAENYSEENQKKEVLAWHESVAGI